MAFLIRCQSHAADFGRRAAAPRTADAIGRPMGLNAAGADWLNPAEDLFHERECGALGEYRPIEEDDSLVP